jgi:hypothetical protein
MQEQKCGRKDFDVVLESYRPKSSDVGLCDRRCENLSILASVTGKLLPLSHPSGKPHLTKPPELTG